MIAAPPLTGYDVFGQPSKSAEIEGRPLGSTLALFRSGKTVVIPAWHNESISGIAARMSAGALVTAKARRVGSIYLVPTSTGGVCVEGARFLTCHRGLLRAGVTYGYQSTATGIDVYGIAANGVSRVSLGTETATVHDNVFFLTRTMKLSSLPKTFGMLTVSYRDGRPPAHVTIR